MEEYITHLSHYTKPDLENIREVTSAEYYYDPHVHLSTHELLVNDHVTMTAFRGWIQDNDQFIKGKVVLDVGCGVGILSMLAAKAGAARVISLEWSHIAQHTKKIVKDNELEDIITVIKSRVEDAILPDGIEQVDVIISMWIGHSLFHGGRLKQLILARDKWLKPSGLIIPDLADLYITAIADDEFRELNIEWWKNVHGYDMSSMTEDVLKYANYSVLAPEKIVTNKCIIKKVDIKTVSYSDMLKEEPFVLTATRNDYVQGFCTFFTVRFSADIKKHEINTEPLLQPTHWGQTCFYIRNYFMVRKKEKIQGNFSVFNLNNDPRFSGIILGIYFKGKRDEVLGVKTFVLRS